jgi:spermine/spermidine synthase
VALVLTAAAGLVAARRGGRAGVALLLAALALAASRHVDAAGTAAGLRVLARMPSFFGFLRVVETDALRILTVNGIGQNYVSLAPAAEPTAYVAFISALPRLQNAAPRNPSALVIGLGAGELADRLQASGASVSVVEIDPRVEQAARRYFGLALPHERVHIEDGRAFLERDTHTYDLVAPDISAPSRRSRPSAGDSPPEASSPSTTRRSRAGWTPGPWRGHCARRFPMCAC